MTREEAIKLLEHISIAYTPEDAYGDYDDPQPYEEAIDMAIEALTDRPYGEWVEPQLIYTDAHKVTCTNCGGRVVIVGETNFCPNCGARMKGGDTE